MRQSCRPRVGGSESSSPARARAAGRPRPFLDTNVIFSGLYSASGSPAAILRLHAEGSIVIVLSRQVLVELVRTFRAKKPELLPLLHAFLTNAPPELSPAPSRREVQRLASCINLTDAPILAAAIESNSDCLVTGNSRHFTPEVERCAGFPIFAPPAYLATLEDCRAEG